ncbi:MAG TPA: phosphatase PAP2 family protein [Nitrospira sp.]|nr:phosphatase PAP2 family protein [Nitrospira sp.]
MVIAMNVDAFLTQAISGLAGESPGLDWFSLYLSDPDVLWVPGILLALYWLWLSPREAFIGAAVLAASIGLVDFVGAQLKHLVARPRPCMSILDLHQLQACGKTFSFPSNHAINTATAAAFLQVLYPRSGWISWPIVALVGIARVYIGAHYVTDVLGGWVLGGLFGAGIAWLLLQWPQFRQRALSPMVSAQADSSAR